MEYYLIQEENECDNSHGYILSASRNNVSMSVEIMTVTLAYFVNIFVVTLNVF